MTRNLFKVRWQGYKFKNNTFSFLKPNILDQYYGAGNLYMTPHDMGKLIYTLQQNKIFNARQTRPIYMNLELKNIQKNIDMVLHNSVFK